MQAQEITGQWNGLLNVQGIQLRLVFHLEKSGDGYEATMDSPDQGARGIPVSSVTYEPPLLRLEVATAGIVYEGSLTPEELISGTFKQGGLSLPLDLSREMPEKESPDRPQEPKAPYPYLVEEIIFENSYAGVTLSGTFTRPKGRGPFPAVVLITGSGPQNRDEEVFGHKPFLVIADFLTRQGIAVLRYDDRGTAKSTGNFSTSTSADFASDVESAVEYLRTRTETDPAKIGLVGHSEGGLIAPMVAADVQDIAFIVLLAGPGVPGYDILLAQTKLIGEVNGMEAAALDSQLEGLKKALDFVVANRDSKTLAADLAVYVEDQLKAHPETLPEGTEPQQYVKAFVSQMASPWMVSFLTYDPGTSLRKVRCPVLALNGEKDLQVPAKTNLEAIRKHLAEGGNSRVIARELPGLNHLFQECETGSPSEYANINQTFSPDALRVLTAWILEQTR
jgi:fermentation-respiration switch protein FrsA (DUF1100 family)